MIRRFVGGTAVAAALTLSLTGCLGDSGGTADKGGAGNAVKLSALQVLEKTSQKTGQIDTFKADISMDMSAEGTTVKATGTTQFRLKPTLAFSMTFDQMSAAGMSMSGMQMMLVDKNMYMKLPQGATGGVPGAKPWIKISLAAAGKQSGMDLDSMLQGTQQADPTQMTKQLTASKDAREVGKETVDGVETTHYTGTYRMSDALMKLTPEQRSALEKQNSGLAKETMSFDVWVDGQDLPRKMSMKSAAGAANPMNYTMVYRDYGKPVTITAPPPAEVGDLSEMLKGMQMPTQPPTTTG